ncbi:MAG: YdgA family protein [Campylobacteraceae bacterium]|jgi:hypothetical protein|nr:YdgA family protein [Campylobacteraceae bacterium]
MKKLLSFFAGVVLLAAVYFCFSVAYANYQTHKLFTDEAGYFDRFGIKYELIEQKRGLFSSTYKTKLTMILVKAMNPSNGTFIISTTNIDSKAEFGVRSFDIFKIGTVQVSCDYDELTKGLFKNSSFSGLPNSTVWDIGFDGVEITIKTEPVVFEIGTINASDTQINITQSNGAVTQYIKGSFDSKTFIMKQHIEDIAQDSGQVFTDMKNLTSDIVLNRNELGTWIGEVKIAAEKYSLGFGNNSFNTLFANYATSAQSREQSNGLMTLGFKMGADRLEFLAGTFNITVKEALLDITISNLEQNSVNAIANKISKINLAMDKAQRGLITASAIPDIILLLKTNPEIIIDIRGGLDDSRINEIAGHIKYIGDNLYDINLSNWREHLDFEFGYKIDKEMVISGLQKRIRANYERRGQASEELDSLVEKDIQNKLDKLQKFGADISGDMITGVVDKNTDLMALFF